ncbi:MAG TPA: tetratricopeptide repeat protein [Candidatus Angelobacter sp.]|jgi:predicted Zn-dependent protease|nr:tetratricopeptide repeat protein [Candidatus Angelobacter sp.]
MKTHRVIFLALGFAGCTLSLTAQRMGVDTSQSPFSRNSASVTNPARADNRSISGTVQDTLGNPLQDVRVELTDGSGAVLNSAYTSSSGRFEFTRVAAGTYQVVATSGLQQASERVEASSFSNMVSIRMAGSRKPADGVEGNSVSVAQYRVPAKAREAYRRAHSELEKGKLDDASKHLAKALEICPNYAEALTLRGILELNQQDSQAAVADLDNAIKADANYAMAYMVLGSALNMQSKFDDAIRALQRGESLAPNYWQAHFEMGKSYIGKADYPAALRQLERAESLAPAEYPLIYLLRAHALLSMKQFPEAMTALQAYLQKDPKGPNVEQAEKMLEQAQAFMARKK